MMQRLIRQCTPQDARAVGDFYDQVTDYLARHVNYPRWTPRRYPSYEYASAMIQTGGMYACWEDERLVGVFVLNEDPQGEYDNALWSRSLARGQYLVIHALATDAARYGQGIAKEMVAFCLAEAKRLGYLAVRLDTVVDNYPAQRLYIGCGFRYVGDFNLGREEHHIPLFSVFEYDLQEEL